MSTIKMPSRDITQLHRTLQRGVNELKRRMQVLGYPVLVTETYRTTEYQNKLYAQGRTTSGKTITNAKGGQSMHEYRLAFDICKNVKGQEYNDNNFFSTAGRIWTEMGGEWGGSWKSFVDKPHFQFTCGLSLKDLQNGKTMPTHTQMKWESEVEEVITDKMLEEFVQKNGWIKASLVSVGIQYDNVKKNTECILFNCLNYAKIRCVLEDVNYNVDYDEQKNLILANIKKKQISIAMNGMIDKLTSINVNDENHIRVRDLEKLGYKVSYDVHTEVINVT